jgi:pimeloyl-ACP methyl ester carboxylesterase
MLPQQLHSICFPNESAPPLIILHGLLGSSKNWTTIGRHLQSHYDVYLLDLRNHGGSFHASSMRWSELVADVLRYIDDKGLAKISLIGHSLGGKLAMKFACEQVKRVQHLVVVDIAAKDYSPHFDEIFRAMKNLNLSGLRQRKEADIILQEWIPNWAMRQFVLTNLVRTKAGFEWQVNLEVLHASLPVIRKNSLLQVQHYTGPSLLIRGEHSDFVEESDLKRMRLHFPKLQCETIEKASHNVHVENRSAFLKTLIKCLRFASD